MSVDRAADQESQSLSEIRKERLHDPDVQERLRQIHEQIDAGEPLIPGISGEELPDFLREQTAVSTARILVTADDRGFDGLPGLETRVIR